VEDYPMIVLRRSLDTLTQRDLQAHWFELALLLVNKRDPETGLLPPLYHSAYERVVDEFAARGWQLALF
jgi:hypothetical protein